MTSCRVPVVEAGLLARRVLHLQPEASSAARARSLLREALAEAGQGQWLDAAELACSELVSNAVLHAHTPITVVVEVGATELVVRVADRSPVLPLLRSYDLQATTGRGLSLVAALTSEHGIGDAGPDGKTIWFTLRGDPQQQSEQDLLAAWDDADWDLDALLSDDRQDPQAGPDAPPERGAASAGLQTVGAEQGAATGGRTVTLLDLPPTLWLAAREHHDALLRELVLYLAEHDTGHEQAAVDLPAADRARATLSAAVVAAVEGAQRAGIAQPALPAGHPAALPWVPARLDLQLWVPDGVALGFAALQDTLDVAERLALAGRLLARPGLPEIVAVRDWACEQVLAQHSGVAAAPWPGTDQERFTTEVHAAADQPMTDWDVLAVRDSTRSVVAADDANRIVAVSGPLAALVGWDPADLVGRRVVTLIPPALREGHVAGFSRHLSSGEAHLLGVPLTLPVLHADGRELTCRLLIEQAPTRQRRVYLAWIDSLD